MGSCKVFAKWELQREYNFAPHTVALLRYVSPDFRRIFTVDFHKEIQKEFSKVYIQEFFVYDLDTMEQTHTLSIESNSQSSKFFFDKETIAYGRLGLGKRRLPLSFDKP